MPYNALAAYPALLLAAAGLAMVSRPAMEAKVAYKADEIEAAKESIALSVMGQLQMGFGDLMWLKSLEYLHNGVGYRMPTHSEQSRGFVERDSMDAPQGLDHAEGVSMALDTERDWRGIVGDLHREIVPYREDHAHSNPTELIPWYQLTVKLNPHLERLYSMGAFFMADFAHDPEEALELLTAGVKANPWSFEIRGGLGRLYYDYFQELEKARVELTEAIALGEKERDRLREDHDKFDNYQNQIFQESFLFLARVLTDLKRYDEAIAVCQRGSEITSYQHLRVQERITTRLRDGLPADEVLNLQAKPRATETGT